MLKEAAEPGVQSYDCRAHRREAPGLIRIVFVHACNPHLPGCCTLIGIRPIRWWSAQYLLARKHRGYQIATFAQLRHNDRQDMNHGKAD